MSLIYITRKSLEKQRSNAHLNITKTDLALRARTQVRAIDNETPREIASRVNLDVNVLVELNSVQYDGLYADAKLMEGTVLDLPPTSKVAALGATLMAQAASEAAKASYGDALRSLERKQDAKARRAKLLVRLSSQRVYVESWMDGRLLRLSRHQTDVLKFAKSLNKTSRLRRELESRFGRPKNEGFEALVHFDKLPSLPFIEENSFMKEQGCEIVLKAVVLCDIMILESELYVVVRVLWTRLKYYSARIHEHRYKLSESNKSTWLLGNRNVWASSLKPKYSFENIRNDVEKKALIKSFQYVGVVSSLFDSPQSRSREYTYIFDQQHTHTHSNTQVRSTGVGEK